MNPTRSQHTHQTTIRFGEELWLRLEEAAAHREVSVAHYVREAARDRLESETFSSASAPARAVRVEVEEARQHSLGEAESSAALWEQGRLARERARRLRDEARDSRDRLRSMLATGQ